MIKKIFCYLHYDNTTIVSKIIKTPFQENTFKIEILAPYKKLQIRQSRGYIPWFARNRFMSEAEYYHIPEKNKYILKSLNIKLYEFSKELYDNVHNIVNSKEYLDFLIDFNLSENEYKKILLKRDFEKKAFNHDIFEYCSNLHEILENYFKNHLA